MQRPDDLTEQQISEGLVSLDGSRAATHPEVTRRASRSTLEEIAAAGSWLHDKFVEKGIDGPLLGVYMHIAGQVQGAVTLAGFTDPWPAANVLLNLPETVMLTVIAGDLMGDVFGPGPTIRDRLRSWVKSSGRDWDVYDEFACAIGYAYTQHDKADTGD